MFLNSDFLKTNCIALAIAVSVASLVFFWFLIEQYTAVHILSNIEKKFTDQRILRRGPRSPGDEVVIVAIDSKSSERLGRWPWSRTTHAALIDRLREWGASTVAFDVLFTEVQGEVESARLRRIAATLPSPGSDADALDEIGANVNYGLADVIDKLDRLPANKRAEIEADIQAIEKEH